MGSSGIPGATGSPPLVASQSHLIPTGIAPTSFLGELFSRFVQWIRNPGTFNLFPKQCHGFGGILGRIRWVIAFDFRVGHGDRLAPAWS